MLITNIPEVDWYAEICRVDYPDAYTISKQVYGRTPAGHYAAAEYGYFYLHDELPEWAMYIEQVIREGDNYIFVHRDTHEDQ